MNQNENDYRPANVEFEVIENVNETPLNLGHFESEKDASDFMHKNFVYLTADISVVRFMDNFEKSEIRKEVCEALEHDMPKLKKTVYEAESALIRAKENLKNAQEAVSSTQTKVEAQALSVKRGVVGMSLDESYVYKVSFNSKYFFYTYIDKQIKLCKISEIPQNEQAEMYNNTSINREFFEQLDSSEK